MASRLTARIQAPEWASLFRAAPVGIAITVGPDDVYAYANDEYARLVGHPTGALLGRPYDRVSRSPEAKGFAGLAHRMRDERTSFSRRDAHMTVDASDIYLDVQLEPLLGSTGEVEGILHIAVDVTARTRAEREVGLLRLEQVSVLEQMTNGVLIMDRDGRLTFRNRAALEILGEAAATTPSAASFVDKFAMRDAAGHLVSAEQTPLSRALRGDRILADYTVVREDGRELALSYSAGPVVDPTGDIVGAVGVFSDRSTERQLRETLAASEDRLRRVYEAVACGILVRGPDGLILFANREAGRVLGVDPTTLIGLANAPGVRRYSEAGAEMSPEDVPGRAAMREARAVRDVRWRLVRADGSEVWVRVDASPILGADGRPEYVVTSFIDVTERKLAEDQLTVHVRQQAAIAELGRLALAATKLGALFDQVVATVNAVLGSDVSRVIEHEPDQHRLVVRAGQLAGQRLPGTTGTEVIDDAPELSQAGFTMATNADIIANDLAHERRFAIYPPIVEAGYNSTVTVVIPGHERPFGMIAVISRSLEFAEGELVFVRAVANVLGEAIERVRAIERLEANDQRLRTIVANLPIELMVYDANGRVSLTAGRSEAEASLPRVIGESVFDRNHGNPTGLNRIMRALGGEEVAEEVRDTDRVIDMRHHPVLDADGKVTEVIGLAIDITDRANAEADVIRKEAFVRAIFESVDTHIAVLDREGVVVDANGKWLEFARGSGQADMKDATVGDDYVVRCRDTATDEGLQAAAGIAAVLEGKRTSFTLEFPTDRDDGRRWYQMFAQPMRSSEGGVVISHRDITERKRVEDALEHQALHDVVTDLPNRVLLRDRLRQAILAARRRNNLVALLFIDLDRFKELNDTFGHQAGDVVLREVGERFVNAVRSSDTVARLGGDEFAVLIPLAADTEEALTIAKRAVASLQEPFLIEGESTFIEASVGVVICPEHGEDVLTLMRRADVAMYSAKRSGSGVQLYEPEKDLHSRSAIGLAGDLRHSIERGELLLHYQPIVDLASGHCVGMEALCRWRHPTRGLVPPAMFIPLAEENGYIKQIGTWTVGEALRASRDWHAPGGSPTFSVNLSMRNLRGHDLPATMAEMIAQTGADPSRLKIEITETAMMFDAEHTLEVLHELQRMGIRLSVDDFGTGYSSLAYLQRLPVDDIKVDRSFVLNMLKNTSDEAIVRSTIELAHNLGLKAIAEGVEDQATLDRLKELGCDQAQGYHMGRPMPRDEMINWLATSPWGSGPA